MSTERILDLRLGVQDHTLLLDVMAPRLGSRSAVLHTIRQVVLEGHQPLSNPRLVEASNEVGIPVTVDPFTAALQTTGSGSKSFRQLPYYRSGAVEPADLATDTARAAFVNEVLGHQLNVGASQLTAPYFYLASTADEWWEINVKLIAESRSWMSRHDRSEGLVVALAGAASRLGSATSVQDQLPRLATAAVLANATSMWLMLSPLGRGEESYDKLLGVVETIGVFREHGLDVRLARAGRYGPALVAAGASGFDAGAGLGDAIDLRSTMASRRNPPALRKPAGGAGKEEGGRSARVYVPSVGHSLPRSHLKQLFANEPMTRALAGCADAYCCPTVEVMLKDWRGHTIRARAQSALELVDVPPTQRLGYSTDRLGNELASISQLNRHLAAAGRTTIKDRGPRELQQVLEHLKSKKALGSAA